MEFIIQFSFISAAAAEKNKELGKEKLVRFEQTAGRESQISLANADELEKVKEVRKEIFFY